MSNLEEIEAIKRVKYKYCRCLDSKDWAGLAETLTEDAKSAYDSGKYSYEGREAILGFLRESLDTPRIIGQHQAHHPEIDLTGPTTATGTWYLEDFVLFLDMNMRLHGAAFYHDEYVKVDGEWKIKMTSYERTYEEVQTADAVQQVHTRWDPAE